MTDDRKQVTEGRSDVAGHFLAGGGGLVVALFIAFNAYEDIVVVPWASYSYYWLGWPVMCALIALITRIYPERSWRWTMSMAVGQVFATILAGAGNMVPVAMIYVILLSVPQFAVGSWMSRRVLAARTDPDPEMNSSGDNSTS